MKIILGSQSAGRRLVLADMGYRFEVMPADIDEKAIRMDDSVKLTIALAHAKADALLPRISEAALLITSDQVVVYGGLIREKPQSAGEAAEFLESYALHPAETVTSVVVTDTKSGRRFEGTDTAKIWFKPMPAEVMRAYIESGDPYQQSGGFDHAHPMLAPYVKNIEGEPESVTGLPRALTAKLIGLAEDSMRERR